MSLINKLLTDLEERHTLLNGKDEAILDGLTSVSSRRNEQRINVPVNFIIVSFFLAASFIVVYGITREQTGRKASIVNDPPAPVQLDVQAKIRNDIRAQGDIRQKVTSDKDESGITPAGLKPAITTPYPEPAASAEIAGGSPSVINEISIVEDNATITFSLSLAGSIHYNAFSLANPDRVVLEIDNARFAAEIPVVDHIKQIRGIRVGNRPGKALTLVIDANQPL